MRASSKSYFSDDQIAFLKGTSSPSDGGQGFFRFESSSSATDDGADVIEPTGAGNGRFLRVDLNDNTLTAKGDLITRNSSGNDRLPVGTDNYVLTADSSQSLGVKWAAVPGAASSNMLSALDYGVTGDGTTDDTTAIQNLVDNSDVTSGHRTVFFPAGNYRITGTITVSQGVLILGDGMPSSDPGGAPGGTNFVFNNGTSDGFVWDIAVKEGAMGGLENVGIQASSSSAGRAVAVIPNWSTSFVRLTDFILRNVVFTNATSQQWDRLISVENNSSLATTECIVENVLDATVSPSVDNQNAFYFEEAIVMGTTIRSRGTGGVVSSTNGLRLKDCESFQLSSIILPGYLTIDGGTGFTYTNLCFLSGFFGYVNIDVTDLKGTGNIESRTSIDCAAKDFKITSPQSDNFSGRMTAIKSNVTGDSTPYQVIWDTEDWDKNGTFDPSTGEHTARCAGIQEFSGALLLTGIASGHGRVVAGLIHRNSGGTTQEEALKTFNLASIESSAGFATVDIGPKRFDMDEGDTVEVRVEVSGGAKDIDVSFASGTLNYCYFEGRYVG
jgi:hypothetical protein